MPPPTKSAADEASRPPPKEMISRGNKRPSPLGTTLWLTLRTLDLPLQYKLLSGAWSIPLLTRVGLSAAVPVVATSARTGIAAIDRLGLSGPSLLLLAMAAGSTAKHAYWLVAISYEEFLPSSALAVSAFNSAFNSINSLLLVAAATSASTAGPTIPVPLPLVGTVAVPLPMAAAAVLYTTGMGLELISEIQRRRFKDQPENKGLICRTGLFGMARHVNYGGYALWRTGFTLAAGGWVAGAATAAFNAWAFISMSTVELDSYMGRKYGEQWARYKSEVKYLLFPGIY